MADPAAFRGEGFRTVCDIRIGQTDELVQRGNTSGSRPGVGCGSFRVFPGRALGGLDCCTTDGGQDPVVLVFYGQEVSPGDQSSPRCQSRSRSYRIAGLS